MTLHARVDEFPTADASDQDWKHFVVRPGREGFRDEGLEIRVWGLGFRV